MTDIIGKIITVHNSHFVSGNYMIPNCMFFSVTIDRDQWEALCKPSWPGNGGGRQGGLVPVWDGQ